ncbi:MAG: hypothetical protein JO131_01705 [Gammaproteobacteria bacterium]|nr:hypothetical protein [Gammaproteobacteria bacterium]
MKSIRKIIAFSAPRQLSAFPVRHLHASIPSFMPVRGPNGERLWTDDELRAAARKGFEDAGGQWSDPSANHPQGQYTAEDLKKALEEGLNQADRYVGEAMRKAYEKGHEDGEIDGINKERLVSEKNVEEVKRVCKKEMEEKIAIASQAAYKNGVFANPDFIKAKEQGRIEGEKIAWKKAEEMAAEEEKNTSIKIQRAKENAVNEYLKNKKIYNRFYNWIQKLKQQKPIVPIEKNKEQEVNSFFRNVVAEIPLIFFQINIHRPLKHDTYNRGVVGWGHSSRRLTWSSATIMKYIYEEDKLRIKDLYSNSKIIIDSEDGDTAIHNLNFMVLYFLLIVLILNIVSNLIKSIQDQYDRYLHGESHEQHTSRKEIEKNCHELNQLTPHHFGTKAFTSFDENVLKHLKNNCKSAEQFKKDMLLEMQARRQSGFGDSTFFGPRKLADVYDDSNNAVPLLQQFSAFKAGMVLRAKEQKEQAELAAEQAALAAKKEKYDRIKHTALGK